MADTPATYLTKAAAAATSAGITTATINVRLAQTGYPVDQTHCTLSGGKVRYEVDHVDADGKVRTADEVAAILKALLQLTADPQGK